MQSQCVSILLSEGWIWTECVLVVECFLKKLITSVGFVILLPKSRKCLLYGPVFQVLLEVVLVTYFSGFRIMGRWVSWKCLCLFVGACGHKEILWCFRGRFLIMRMY